MAHPKSLADAKSLEDAKSLAYAKTLANVKTLADAKTLADSKTLARPGTSPPGSHPRAPGQQDLRALLGSDPRLEDRSHLLCLHSCPSRLQSVLPPPETRSACSGQPRGCFPPADELTCPCLATRTLGWPPGHCCACSPRQVYLALHSPATTWRVLAPISLEHQRPRSLAGRSMWLRPLSLHHLCVAILVLVQGRLVLRPAAVITSASC